jgi:putative transposase
MDNYQRSARRSVRLTGADYSRPGAYFVTICAFHHRCIFGVVDGSRIRLTPIGQIVRHCWFDIPRHFVGVYVDAFVVMPNHIHGIVAIEERARRAVPLQVQRFGKPVARSIPTIVRSYKSAVTRLARRLSNHSVQVWQSNYFERILRNGSEFSNAAHYILENPLMWYKDKESPIATL